MRALGPSEAAVREGLASFAPGARRVAQPRRPHGTLSHETAGGFNRLAQRLGPQGQRDVTVAPLPAESDAPTMRGVDTMTGGTTDQVRSGGGRSAIAEEAQTGVYRTTKRNVVLAAFLTCSAVFGCSDFTGSSRGWPWTWRVPVAVVVAAVLVTRALRRALIVSPFGLEARRTLGTWRVPWSAVESFAVGGASDPTQRDGPLTVVLIDGSTRSKRVGFGRPGQRHVTEAAAAARRNPLLRARGYLDPNRPLQVFILAGVALMVACAVMDAGRINRRLLRAGEVSYTADELRELELEIAIAGGTTVALSVTLVLAGVAAGIWSRHGRGVAPSGPWPAALRFPGDDDSGASSRSPAPYGHGRAEAVGPRPSPSRPSPFDIPPLVVCCHDGVFSADGTLLAAISRRLVAWSELETCTYWSARGVADFSVQIQPPAVVTAAGGALSAGARWHLTSWESPLPAHVEVAAPGGAELILRSAGTADLRLTAERWLDSGDRYTVIDDHHRPQATMKRSWRRWECRALVDLPITTRRLLCVAALWAERRSLWLSSSD